MFSHKPGYDQPGSTLMGESTDLVDRPVTSGGAQRCEISAGKRSVLWLDNDGFADAGVLHELPQEDDGRKSDLATSPSLRVGRATLPWRRCRSFR